VESFATGANDGGQQLRHTTQTFDPVTGDLQHTQARASLPAGTTFEFGGTADAQGYTLPSTQIVESSTEHDAWGNPMASCASANLHADDRANCLRYSEVTVDAAYAQLPASERIAVGGTTGASFCATSTRTAPFCLMETRATWDRGFGVLKTVTDPNRQVSTVAYDGLGRLSAMIPPGFDGCAMDNAPTQVFKYELGAGEDLPVHRITALQNHGNADCTEPAFLESVSYVDGLGRARVALARRGDLEWERSGSGVFNARGTPYLGFQNDIWSGHAPTPREALSVPRTRYTEAAYDAFGRVIQAIAEDESQTVTYYGATSTTVCDALDLSSHPHVPADVHDHARGRPRPRHRPSAAPAARVGGQPARDLPAGHHLPAPTAWRSWSAAPRRWTTRRSVMGADPVDNHLLLRTFTYDTLGRRVASTDPDSDSRTSGTTAANRTWRYLFNDVGDLAAVRDPRGCGQNFYYDHAGRLIAEDYVWCSEAMHPRRPARYSLARRRHWHGRGGSQRAAGGRPLLLRRRARLRPGRDPEHQPRTGWGA
jgi:YD repeat-containing protein